MGSIQTYHTEGHAGPELEKTYLHVPFDVPENAARIEVALTYRDRIGSNPTLVGGNTVDLGVFDERGIEFLKAGFRGWSGSERDDFWITRQAATPGYLAGPLNPGRWHALLGLYKVAPQGCSYALTVKITLEEGGEEPWRAPEGGPLPASRPKAAHAPWLRGELHCHTHHSDGKFSAAELVERARERGLDFLAVSDHNTTASLRELAALTDPGLVLVRGVEATTFYGHFNAWGISDWVDFRVNSPEEMASALAYAQQLGALTSCGHPKPFGPGWDYPEVANYACVEVWNGPWSGLNGVSLAFWLEQINSGRRIPAVGGSDFHRVGEVAGGRQRDLGTPTNWVYVPGEATEASILEAVRRGHVSLADEPDGPLLTLWAGEGWQALQGDTLARPAHGVLPVRVDCLRGEGGLLRLLDQSGVLAEQVVTGETYCQEFELAVEGSRYVRAELRTEFDWLRAMTNPVYIA